MGRGLRDGSRSSIMPSMRTAPTKTLALISALALLTLAPITPVSAVAGFILLVYLPGRLLLPLLGVDGHWSRAGRIVLSLAVSWSVVPCFLNPVWHLTNDRSALLMVVWTALVVLAWAASRRDRRASGEPPQPFIQHRSTAWLAGVIGLIVIPAIVLSYWPSDLSGYPVPAEIHDFIKHHAILASLERSPLPLGNIFYANGAGGPVHYYHFFYLIPATVRAWGQDTLSFELAFALAGASVAIPTVGIVYAVAKRFACGTESGAALSAALVTLIGAFDLFLYLPTMLRAGRPLVMIDHWAEHPYVIHNFLFQMIWSPQNVLGLLTVLLGVYLLSARTLSRSWVIWGPILGVSVLGSSVWVAMGALPALGLWAITKLRQLPAIVGVGLLMTAACLPLVMAYTSSGAHPDRWLTTDWPLNPYSIVGHLWGPGLIANLCDLPVALVLELGAKVLLLPLVPLVLWRRMWRDDGLRWLVLAAGASLLFSSVVRVQLEHNDLRHKMILLAMAFASIMAGGALAADPIRPRWWNPMGWRLATGGRARAIAVASVLLLGAATELYEAPLTAVRRYVEDYLDTRSLDRSRRELVVAERAAMNVLRHELPAGAVVQAEGTPDRARLAQMIHKQIGAMEPWDDIKVFAPADRDRYALDVAALLRTLRAGESVERTHAALLEHRITHVFVGVIESETWKHLERFDDGRYFDDVYRNGAIRIVAVRRDAPAPSRGDAR